MKMLSGIWFSDFSHPDKKNQNPIIRKLKALAVLGFAVIENIPESAVPKYFIAFD